jgi:putative membrane protein (TIGR04086 family)
MKVESQSKKSLLKRAGLSAATGLVITALVLLVVALLASAGILPADMAEEYVLCAVIIGTTFSGVICAKKTGGAVLVAGLLSAACFLIVVLLGTLFVGGGSGNGALTLKIILAAVVGGCFGGTLRLYRKTKKAKIRKRI